MKIFSIFTDHPTATLHMMIMFQVPAWVDIFKDSNLCIYELPVIQAGYIATITIVSLWLSISLFISSFFDGKKLKWNKYLDQSTVDLFFSILTMLFFPLFGLHRMELIERDTMFIIGLPLIFIWLPFAGSFFFDRQSPLFSKEVLEKQQEE